MLPATSTPPSPAAACTASASANGFARIDLGAIDRPAAILRQSDGKYVVAGAHEVYFDNGFIPTTIKSFGVVRLAAHGTLDPTFGTDGILTHQFAGGAEGTATSLIQQSDGKIIAAGTLHATFDVALARYTATGGPDGTFGSSGRKTGPLRCFRAPSLGLQSDGKLIVACFGTDLAGLTSTLYVARYTTSGAHDMTFGSGTTEPGETCDDGNTTSGDGCDANCTPSACGNGITAGAETCDDGNTDAGCQVESDGAPCNGGDLCTTGTTCTAGFCGGGSPLSCSTCERCDADAGCVADVRPSCFSTAVERASTLQIKDSPFDAKDQLQWQIKRGDFALVSEYGNPVPNGGDDYALCIFDVSGLTPKVLLAAPVPAGGTCQGNPWRRRRRARRALSRARSRLRARGHGRRSPWRSSPARGPFSLAAQLADLGIEPLGRVVERARQ